jgi:hypothetical protein
MTSPPLTPEHRDDLRRSGLSDATIHALGIRSLAPEEWLRYCSPALIEKVTSLLLFPYPGTDDFYRLKLFPAVSDGDGRHVRYYQPARTPPAFYVPPTTRAVLADPGVELLAGEGEKKAAKGNQENLSMIGLGGLWNWRHAGRPILDFDLIDCFERSVLLVPDSDVWTRTNLLQATYALGKEFESRGAVVAVIKLPTGADGGKVGLDDFLVAQTVDELRMLPRPSLKDRVFARVGGWWKNWSKRQAEAQEHTADARTLLETAGSVIRLHPAQDLVGDVLTYGLPTERGPVIITSAREVWRGDQPPKGIALRHRALPFSSISPATATAWLNEATGSVAMALDEIEAFLRRHVAFKDEHAPRWLAAWTLGTYCHRAFPIYPYLSIRSPERRCGKTRLLETLSLIAFNAPGVDVNPSEAVIFRRASTTAGTQLLDEIENLMDDRERLGMLIEVLNAGFQKGGVVSRLQKVDGDFVEIPFEAYAPRALAGISRIRATLEDRSLFLAMIRKRKSDRVERLPGRTDPAVLKLRAQAALAMLTHIGTILQLAPEATQLLHEQEEIDDRAVDLYTPLLTLALVADGEDDQGRAARLLEVFGAMGDSRNAAEAEGPSARLLRALADIAQGQVPPYEIRPPDLLKRLHADPPGLKWIKSVRHLGGVLSPLGIVIRQRREDDDKRRRYRYYTLEPSMLKDLLGRYGTEDEEAPASQNEPSASSSRQPYA